MLKIHSRHILQGAKEIGKNRYNSNHIPHMLDIYRQHILRIGEET